MKKLIIIVGMFVCMVSNRLIAQTPGNLDSSFGVAGKVIQVFSDKCEEMAIISQTMLGNGTFLTLAETYRLTQDNNYISTSYLMRLMADGSMDINFGQGGKTMLGFGARSLLLQKDGKIILTGNNGDEIVVSRYLPDGAIDLTYGTNGIEYTGIFSFARAAQLQSDGRILIGAAVMGNSKLLLGRLMADGSRDFSFGEDGIILIDFDVNNQSEWISGINVLTDAGILLTGISYQNNNYNTTLLKLKSDGQADSTFSSDGKQLVPFAKFFNSKTILHEDGKITIGGSYYYNNYANSGFILARYKANGNADSSFGINGIRTGNAGGANDFMGDFMIQTDGKIVVAGGSSGKFALARFTAIGNPDNTFSGDGKQTTVFGTYQSNANKVYQLNDGKILLTGTVQINDSTYALAMARYHSGLNVSVQEIKQLTEVKVYPNPFLSALHIEYTLLKSEIMNISLYDLNGSCVETMMQNENRKAGSYNEVLKLDDAIPLGIYILRISIGSSVKSIRLVK